MLAIDASCPPVALFRNFRKVVLSRFFRLCGCLCPGFAVIPVSMGAPAAKHGGKFNNLIGQSSSVAGCYVLVWTQITAPASSPEILRSGRFSRQKVACDVGSHRNHRHPRRAGGSGRRRALVGPALPSG